MNDPVCYGTLWDLFANGGWVGVALMIGRKQATFKGWPLCSFVGDKAAGDINGQDLKDVHLAVNPV